MFFKKRQAFPEVLNICLVARKFPFLGRSGKHGFLWPIAKSLARRGHRVTIITWKSPQGDLHEEIDKIRSIFIGERTRRPFEEFPRLAKKEFLALHNQDPFHIVHCIDDGGILIAKEKKTLKVGVIFDVDATHLPEMFSIMGLAQDNLSSIIRTSITMGFHFVVSYLTRDRQLLNYGDAVFVTTPEQKLALERYYLYPDHRTFTIPYGIEVGDLSPREKSDELKAKLGIPATSHLVVSTSEMTELAEMVHLLRAFEKVVIKKPNSRLIVVGEGPLMKDIEYEALNLALGSKVLFVGSIPTLKLPDYIALADVFVNLSAKTSGFEPTVLEAMAQKKVIVGSEVSPIAAIVEEGIDGFLIRPADQRSLVEILLKIFNQELPTEQIGEQARQKVMKLFDMDTMVRQTLVAYSTTLQKTGFYLKSGAQLSHSVATPSTT